MVSTPAKSAAFASETGEVFIALITIAHPNLTQPIRVSSDGVNTVSRGNTFLAFPFEYTPPTLAPNARPKAQLRIDNVEQQIMIEVRSIDSAPTVLFEVVLASSHDTVEVSFPDFELRKVEWDALVVDGELTFESYLDEPFPAVVFSPATFPGLF